MRVCHPLCKLQANQIAISLLAFWCFGSFGVEMQFSPHTTAFSINTLLGVPRAAEWHLKSETTLDMIVCVECLCVLRDCKCLIMCVIKRKMNCMREGGGRREEEMKGRRDEVEARRLWQQHDYSVPPEQAGQQLVCWGLERGKK